MFPERDMHWFVDTQQVIAEERKEGRKQSGERYRGKGREGKREKGEKV